MACRSSRVGVDIVLENYFNGLRLGLELGSPHSISWGIFYSFLMSFDHTGMGNGPTHDSPLFWPLDPTLEWLDYMKKFENQEVASRPTCIVFLCLTDWLLSIRMRQALQIRMPKLRTPSLLISRQAHSRPTSLPHGHQPSSTRLLLESLPLIRLHHPIPSPPHSLPPLKPHNHPVLRLRITGPQ